MEAILWLVGAAFALSWGHGIRTRTASGVGVTIQTVNTTMLFFVSLFVSPVLGSTWHLLWLFPLSWVIGTLSLAPPFAFLTPIGQDFRKVCCIGLDQSEISDKRAAFHEGAELTGWLAAVQSLPEPINVKAMAIAMYLREEEGIEKFLALGDEALFLHSESLCLLLHISDRVSFSTLSDSDERFTFMEMLIQNTMAELIQMWTAVGLPRAKAENLSGRLRATYNEVAVSYAQYENVFGMKEEGGQESVLREFLTRVSESSRITPGDPFGELGLMRTVNHFLQDLDIQGHLTD